MIYYAPITQPDGASKVVSSFDENKHLFLEKGIKLDTFAPKGETFESRTSKTSLKRTLKDIVFKIDYIGIIRNYYNFYVRGNKGVRCYLESKKENYDVIFLHETPTCFRYLQHDEGKKIVMVMHTMGDVFQILLIDYPLLRYTFFYNFILKRLKKKIFENVDLIVFNSKLALNIFEKKYPYIRQGQATYVDNGIADFEHPEEHLNHLRSSVFEIVCIGNVIERKGQGFIVDALSELSDEEKRDIHFTIVGEGVLRQELEIRVKKESLDKYITFCGRKKNVIPYLDKAHIFILPSMEEGMPISILEAMRSGLPVVSTPVGGVPKQVIDGENGILIEPSKEGVKHFLRHIKEYDWSEMGRKSRQRYLEKFSIQQTIARYAELLNNV